MCTNDDFSTSPQTPSACLVQHVIHDVATAVLGTACAFVSSAACLLVNIGAACVLVTSCAWPPHSLTLCSSTFFEEVIDISGMPWHVTVLIVVLAVAPLAALKSTLSRMCAVSRSPRNVSGMQVSYTTNQLLRAHCATQLRRWHGVLTTLWCHEAYTMSYSLRAVCHCPCPLV